MARAAKDLQLGRQFDMPALDRPRSRMQLKILWWAKFFESSRCHLYGSVSCHVFTLFSIFLFNKQAESEKYLKMWAILKASVCCACLDSK
jgi:hypothetical protein